MIEMLTHITAEAETKGADLVLIRALIEEASEEYITFLRRAHSLFRERTLTGKIESEIERATAQIKSAGKVFPSNWA